MNLITKTYYKITFPNNTCYIGSTINYRKRCQQHKSKAKLNECENSNVQAINEKYGYKDWVYEILFEEKGDKEYHSKREYTLIQDTPNTLNIEDGRKCLIGQSEYDKKYLKNRWNGMSKEEQQEQNRKVYQSKRLRLDGPEGDEMRRKYNEYQRKLYWEKKNKQDVE